MDRLPFLVDKMTTCGNLRPDIALVRELCECCCQEVGTVRQIFRLITVQLRRPHAQIRLGSLKLLSDLSSPSFLLTHASGSADPSTVRNVCKMVRDLILTHLQDLQTHCLGADPEAPSLPPPPSAAKEMQVFAINLLLDWEEQLQNGRFPTRYTSDFGVHTLPDPQPLTWIPSSLARGQFKGLLRFLRSGEVNKPSRTLNGSSSLIAVKKLFLELDRKRSTERQRLLASQEAEAVTARRHLKRCLTRISALSDQIEENLTSLASVLELLVPDPFQQSCGDVNRSDDIGEPEISVPLASGEHNRAHGRLFGSSSGLGLGAEGIEIRLPCVPGSSGQIRVPIIRDDNTRVLEESAQEHAKLARERHEPLLYSWLQTLESAESTAIDQTLRSQCATQTTRVQNWLSRLKKLTHLFYDRIMFVNSETDNHQTGTSDDHQDDSVDSSDTSDFEEVEPVTTTPKPVSAITVFDKDISCASKFDQPESVNSTTLDFLQEKPHEQADLSEGANNTRCSSEIAIPPKIETPLPYSSASIDLPSKSTVVWRANESLHRFWRPIHPDEYEAPPEYMAQAISASSALDPPPNESTATVVESTDSLPETAETEATDRATHSVVQNTLACWAPLLSGKLCPRRDLSGRCPIHGRIVKRDPVDGRPVDPKDRESLHAEAAEARQARAHARVAAAKSQARRRYPGLVNLNKRPDTTYSRLKSRVLNKKALHRVVDTLEAEDQQSIANRFSDNFVHAVNPK
ncbi:hypothetical protein CLF_103656 [Clonorchis sinensis]|uniref:UV-stimulated scaffold protein A C-terminal domain-containing protein n=1 Tax=Clonorchis sinensis TaxID=79923 RepID=G7YA49_CLOSI|nr:hypothetical protein CLF_103656 [Clonorchis sinensis]